MFAAIGTTMDVYLWSQKPKTSDDSPPPEKDENHHHKAPPPAPILESANQEKELPPSLGEHILLSLPDHHLRLPDGRSHSIATSISSLPSVMDADENIQQHKTPKPETKQIRELSMYSSSSSSSFFFLLLVDKSFPKLGHILVRLYITKVIINASTK